MTELTKLTLADARAKLAAKEITSVELTEAHLAAAKASDKLNAYVTLTPDIALEMAAKSDARIAKGDARPLEGLPLGVKDLFCTEGVRTTACSNILDEFPLPYELTVSAYLCADSAVMLGKLNNDELEIGSSNETSRFGSYVNP